VAGSCEHDNEPLGSIEGRERLDQVIVLHGVCFFVSLFLCLTTVNEQICTSLTPAGVISGLAAEVVKCRRIE
jgi:hypothetical protein